MKQPEKNEVRILRFSGGRDSTALLHHVLENDIPYDEIIFADTGVLHPELYEHIEKVKEKTGVEITTVGRTFEADVPKRHHDKLKTVFEYYMIHILKRSGEQGYSWSDYRNRWCTYVLKTQPIEQYCRKKYEDKDIMYYVAISADEQTRITKEKNKMYPLVAAGQTTKDNLEKMKELGYDWGGLYDKLSRNYCYLCPLQRMEELAYVMTEHPEKWEYMKQLDEDAIVRTGRRFRENYSMDELQERLEEIQHVADARPDRETLKHEMREGTTKQVMEKYGVPRYRIEVWCKEYGLPHRQGEIKTIPDAEWEEV